VRARVHAHLPVGVVRGHHLSLPGVVLSSQVAPTLCVDIFKFKSSHFISKFANFSISICLLCIREWSVALQIYGMQFDLAKGSTASAASPSTSVSSRWLGAVFFSLFVDWFVSAPAGVSVGILIAAVSGRRALDEELERRARMTGLAHVNAGEVEFAAERADEFVAWLQRTLMWYGSGFGLNLTLGFCLV
jgi:hypothetical protein